MNLVIKHQSGKSNTNADAFSRNPVHECSANKHSCLVLGKRTLMRAFQLRLVPSPMSAFLGPRPDFSLTGSKEGVSCLEVNSCLQKKMRHLVIVCEKLHKRSVTYS